MTFSYLMSRIFKMLYDIYHHLRHYSHYGLSVINIMNYTAHHIYVSTFELSAFIVHIFYCLPC